MDALSIMQPWASLIVGGPLQPPQKPIENRTWKPPARLIGKRFAIHASKKLDLDAFTELQHGLIEGFDRHWPYAKPIEFPTSAVIGMARLVRVFIGEPQGLIDPVYPEGMPDDCKRWYGGPIGFELREVVRIEEPVECKGALGFWRMPDEVEAKVRAQLEARAA